MSQKDSCIVWICGLSGSGKSTLAKALKVEMQNRGYRWVSLLDGDQLRSGLNSDLGFEDRDRRENLRRAAHVCKLLTQNSDFVIASFITPTNDMRRMVRQIFEGSSFLMLGLDCSLAACEQRDVKGLYQKARAGEIRQFTGIDSPFDDLRAPEIDLILDSERSSLEQIVTLAAESIIKSLKLE